jgi:putative phosphoribosyl transferase
MIFVDRVEAGKKLVTKLLTSPAIRRVEKEDLLVLAIPRGGVVVGKEVAQRLGCALSLVVTKKVGVPGHEELAVGAMDPDGEVVWDEALVSRLGLSRRELVPQVKKAKEKIQKYKEKFEIKELGLRGKTVVVVDDGIATGRTIEAAIKYLRVRRYPPEAIIVAVPVCAQDTAERLKQLADEFICLSTPSWFGAVGQFYERFEQVEDEEVVKFLHESRGDKDTGDAAAQR